MHRANHHKARRRQVNVEKERAAIDLGDRRSPGQERLVDRNPERPGNRIAFLDHPVTPVTKISQQQRGAPGTPFLIEFLEAIGIHAQPNRST